MPRPVVLGQFTGPWNAMHDPPRLWTRFLESVRPVFWCSKKVHLSMSPAIVIGIGVVVLVIVVALAQRRSKGK
jgi:hypothetical protein